MEIKLLKNKDFLYKVKRGDTLQKISNQFNTTESKLISDNCLNDKNIEEGDVLYIAEENLYTYVVKPLDTISIIANKFNVSNEYIIQKNNLINNKLFIGQILII